MHVVHLPVCFLFLHKSEYSSERKGCHGPKETFLNESYNALLYLLAHLCQILDPYIRTMKKTSVKYNKHHEKTIYSEFKKQVVQELLKEDKTIAQIAAEYEVHPTQLN